MFDRQEEKPVGEFVNAVFVFRHTNQILYCTTLHGGHILATCIAVYSVGIKEKMLKPPFSFTPSGFICEENC